jgi:hypothetical protein
MTAKQAPDPVLKAAVLCDQAIQEKGTNKWTLVGTFDGMSLSREPSQDRPALHPQCALYFKLAECLGDYAWELTLMHLGEQMTILGGFGGGFKAADRLQPIEFAVNIRMLPLAKLGKYAFRLSVNGKMVTDVEFKVGLIPPLKEGR